MGVTIFFLQKNLTTFLVIASESDDLFSCRLSSSHVVLSSVLSKFSHKKINFRSGVTPPLEGVTPGGPPPSDATASYVSYHINYDVE